MAANSITVSGSVTTSGTLILENGQDQWDEFYIEVDEGDATAGTLTISYRSGGED